MWCAKQRCDMLACSPAVNLMSVTQWHSETLLQQVALDVLLVDNLQGV